MRDDAVIFRMQVLIEASHGLRSRFVMRWGRSRTSRLICCKPSWGKYLTRRVGFRGNVIRKECRWMCCPAENWLASYPVVDVVKKREDRLADDGHSRGCSEERERDEAARQH